MSTKTLLAVLAAAGLAGSVFMLPALGHVSTSNAPAGPSAGNQSLTVVAEAMDETKKEKAKKKKKDTEKKKKKDKGKPKPKDGD